MYTNLQRLALDCYYNRVQEYSQAQAEDKIREAFIQAIGRELPTEKRNVRRFFKSVSNEFFQLLEETITPVVNRITLETFGNRVKVETYDLGDKPVYRVKNRKLYKVSQIATGVGSTRRQRMYDSKLETERFELSCMVYEEAFDFLTGRISWTEVCNKVAESFNHKLATLTTGAIFDAYDYSSNPLHIQTNEAGLDTALKALLNKVEAMTGVKCEVLGTKSALSKVPASGGAYLQVDAQDKRDFGYVKVYDSNECVELAQYYDDETNNFEMPNDMLLVVPKGEVLAYIAYEGDVEIVNDDDVYNRKDGQLEMQMQRITHMGIPVASVFGMVQITA